MSDDCYAAETLTGNYILSNGVGCRAHSRVCEVTTDGRVIRSYQAYCRWDCSGCRLSFSGCIVVDTEGYIYMADQYNGRVLVLDSTISLCGIIRNNENVRKSVIQPVEAMCFIPDTQQLILGSAGSRPICVYTVCSPHHPAPTSPPCTNFTTQHHLHHPALTSPRPAPIYHPEPTSPPFTPLTTMHHPAPTSTPSTHLTTP